MNVLSIKPGKEHYVYEKQPYIEVPMKMHYVYHKENLLIIIFAANNYIMKRLLVFLLLFQSLTFYGQTTNEQDFVELIKELHQVKKADRRMQMAFWLPYEYWEIAFKNTETITPEIAQQILSIIKDYNIFLINDLMVNEYDGFVSKSSAEILPGLALSDAAGNRYLPLPDNMISAEMKSLESALMPFLAKTIGQLGDGMIISYFPVKDKNGKLLLSAKGKDHFKIQQGEATYEWKLPLTALSPAIFCPIDKEKLNARWNYCPTHGVQIK